MTIANIKLLAAAALKRTNSNLPVDGTVPAMPDEVYQAAGLTITTEYANGFHKLVEWPDLNVSHPCLLHRLAFNSHLSMMTKPAFPFAVMGLVHLGNHITQAHAVAPEKALSLQSEFVAAQRHPKGWLVSIRSWVEQSGNLIWQAQSDYLYRDKLDLPADVEELDRISVRSAMQQQHWHVPANTGRRYGRVSGDLNPIHLSRLTAKLFGFRQAIAHGMWSKSRCISALAEHCTHGARVSVDFQKPLYIPGEAVFEASFNSQGSLFSLSSPDGQVKHLQGTLTSVQ